MCRAVRVAVLALIFLFGLIPANFAAAKLPVQEGHRFSDLPADHPDRAHILYLAERGLINGYPDGRFGLSDPLNRAAAAKIAIQVASLAARPLGTGLDFVDLPGEHWSVPFVRAGVEAKLINGFEDNTFRPDEPLTRAQLAALAIRATRQSQDRLPSLTLADVQSSDWFYKPALLAVAAGMMEAPDGSFRPGDVATRAEAARAFAQAMVFTPLAFNTPLAVMVVPQRGIVEVQQPGGAGWSRISKATELTEGGRVRTAGASAAAVDFPDGSSLLLDNLSEMVLHRSRGAELIEATEVEDLDVELVKGKLLFALSPRLTASEAEALAPKLSAFLDPAADRLAARVMEPRVRAASSHSGENLPADATRLLLFVDPGSMEPGDKNGAELTIVLANEAGEPVIASKGPVTLDLLTDVGRISNPNPVIPEGYQAVVVTVYPPDAEPEDQKTRVTAVAGEVTSALTVPTSKTSWWSALFSKKTRAKVRMPWSVASVRGTLGEVSADAECNETTLLTGSAHFQSVGGDGTDVGQNQTTRVCSPEEPPDNPAPISSDKQKDLSGKQDWIQNTTNNQLNNASQNNKQAVETANQILQNTIQQLPKDTVSPSVSISSPAGSAVGTPTVTLTGVATDNVAVASVTVGGSGVGVDAAGNWSTSVQLQPGSNTIVAEARDGAGNVSSASVTVTFNAQLPSISVSGPATTKEKKATVTGSATAPGGLQSVTLNGSGITPQAGGSFSVDLELQPGLNLIEAVVTDKLNRSASATLEITSASQPPLLSLDTGETKVAKPVYTLRGSAVAQYAELASVTVLGVPVLFSKGGSFTALVKLNPGENPIDVVATDSAGNTASDSITVTLDAAAPFIHLAQPRSGLVTREATIEVHAVARAAAGIKSATVNGASITVGTDNQARTNVSLKEGENTISAEIVDEVGRKASDSRKVYRVTKPPNVVVSQPEDGLKSAKRELTVSGSTAASFGPLKSVSVNGQGVLLGSDGGFSATITLQNGENSISVSATDLAGNTTTVTRTVNFNPLAATLTLTSPADGMITKESSVTVVGTLQNGDDVESVSVNGISAPVSGGSFSASITLAPGKNTISVALPADAGGASETRTVIFADKAPSLSVSAPIDGMVTAKPEVTVSGSALTSYGTPAVVSVNGLVTDTDSGGGFSYTLALKPGKTSISVSAVDEAGNSERVSRTVEFKPALPLITISSPAGGSTTKEATVTVRGKATSEVGIASVAVNGASASVDAQGIFSATVELKPGENTLSVTATDKVGGTATASVIVLRGGVPPQVSIGSPSDNYVSGQRSIVVSGAAKAAAGKIASVTVNGSGAGVGPDGSWQAQITLSPGENTIDVVATDTLGGTASASRKVTLAEGNPTLDLSSPADGTVSTRNQIAVSGKAKASTPTFTVRVNGSAVSAGSDGSFQTTVTLQGGTNTISVEVTDALNRTASASRTVVFANEKPSISVSSPANGATVTDPAITLSGSARVMKGLQIASVTVNGASVSVGAGGGFSVPVTLTTADADTVFNVAVTDSAGNSVAISHRVKWAPAKLGITLSAPASTATTEKITVSGTVTGALGTPAVTVNGATAAVSAAGSFSAEVTLAKGSNTISASVTDGKGLTASATPVTVTFNPTSPTLSVSPNEGTTVSTPSVSISGSASSQYGAVEISAGGRKFTGGSFSVTVQLQQGSNPITVSASDKYNTVTVTRTINYSPPLPASPVVTITAPIDGTAVAPSVTVTGSWTAAAGIRTLTVNGNPVSFTVDATTGLFSYPLTLAATGANTISVVVADKYGRSGSASVTVTVPPMVAQVDSISGQYSDTVLLKATLTRGGAPVVGKTLWISVDGVDAGETTTDSADKGEVLYSIALPAGLYPINLMEGTEVLASGQLSVSTENLEIAYVGETRIDAAGKIGLKARVREPAADTTPGDLTRAGAVTFTIKSLSDQQVVSVTAPVDADGYAAASLDLSEGYLIEVSVLATLYYSAAATTAAITQSPQITSPLNNTYDADGTITIIGKAHPGAVLSVLVDGVTKATPTADSTGAFSVTVIDQAEGSHTISVSDTTNNLTAGSVSVIVDKTAPVITLNGIAGVSSPTVAVSGSFVEANLKALYVGSTQVTPSGSTFSHNVTLTPGENVIMVMAEDLAGHVTVANAYVTYAAATGPRLRMAPRTTPGVAGSTLTIDLMVDNVRSGQASGVRRGPRQPPERPIGPRVGYQDRQCGRHSRV